MIWVMVYHDACMGNIKAEVMKAFFEEFAMNPLFCFFLLDLLLPPWQEDLDEEGNRLRHIRYTLTLGAAFGPKHSPSTEKQVTIKLHFISFIAS